MEFLLDITSQFIHLTSNSNALHKSINSAQSQIAEYSIKYTTETSITKYVFQRHFHYYCKMIGTKISLRLCKSISLTYMHIHKNSLFTIQLYMTASCMSFLCHPSPIWAYRDRKIAMYICWHSHSVPLNGCHLSQI